MTKLPTINKMKFGIIDEVYMNTLRDATKDFMSMQPALSEMIAEHLKLKSRPFLAKITTAIAMGEVEFERHDGTMSTVDVSWRYEFETVDLHFGGVGGESQPIGLLAGENSYTSENIQDSNDDGNEGCTSGYAYNMAEIANEAFENEIIFGVKVTGDSYPLGFSPKGMQEGDYILVTKFNSTNSCTGYFFDRQGTHDGNCDPL